MKQLISAAFFIAFLSLQSLNGQTRQEVSILPVRIFPSVNNGHVLNIEEIDKNYFSRRNEYDVYSYRSPNIYIIDGKRIDYKGFNVYGLPILPLEDLMNAVLLSGTPAEEENEDNDPFPALNLRLSQQALNDSMYPAKIGLYL